MNKIASIIAHSLLIGLFLFNSASFATDNIHKAAAWGDIDSLQACIVADPGSIHAINEYGHTPLHEVALSCPANKADCVVGLLVANNADVNARSVHRAYPNIPVDSNTPLHCAAYNWRTKMVECLLAHRASVNAQNRWGNTPLHSCVGSIGVARALLEHGADAAILNNDGHSPLHEALLQGREFTFFVLLIEKILAFNGADQFRRILNVKGSRDLFEMALELGVNDVIPLFLQYYDHTNFGPALFLGIQKGKYNLVKDLLEHNASANTEGRLKITPLHVAAECGHSDIAQLLLEHKAAIEALYLERTPLHTALAKGNDACVALLLEHKADPSNSEKYRTSTLHLALKNPHRFDGDFPNSPLRFTPSEIQSKVCLMRRLLEDKAQVNAQDGRGYTPLHLAVRDGYDPIVELLHTYNADLNSVNKQNVTALHIAAHYGHLTTIEMLLQKGAGVSLFAKDCNDCTPKEIAAVFCQANCFELLRSWEQHQQMLMLACALHQRLGQDSPARNLTSWLLQNEIAPQISSGSFDEIAQQVKKKIHR